VLFSWLNGMGEGLEDEDLNLMRSKNFEERGLRTSADGARGVGISSVDGFSVRRDSADRF
jgi:hypothetical protein